MKNWMKVLSLGGILLTAAAAHAQAPADTAPPAAAPPVDTTVTTTTTTETGTPGVIGAETENYGTMPATGGAPIAMALGGMLTAAGAFFVRRKIS